MRKPARRPGPPYNAKVGPCSNNAIVAGIMLRCGQAFDIWGGYANLGNYSLAAQGPRPLLRPGHRVWQAPSRSDPQGRQQQPRGERGFEWQQSKVCGAYNGKANLLGHL
ncbi:hypothetical protein [Thermogemmata fonticola]|uniref:Uncharacterized protein n=1 Tax=Thermogemmata fonticola TaxID=2755323 RepID=A0A7V8VGA8_9BACT|nr:hypothetical protein [Thermogemmata fonticola]MBA2227505.1 hypothetical protein [Thermogemmata fonticola]